MMNLHPVSLLPTSEGKCVLVTPFKEWLTDSPCLEEPSCIHTMHVIAVAVYAGCCSSLAFSTAFVELLPSGVFLPKRWPCSHFLVLCVSISLRRLFSLASSHPLNLGSLFDLACIIVFCSKERIPKCLPAAAVTMSNFEGVSRLAPIECP